MVLRGEGAEPEVLMVRRAGGAFAGSWYLVTGRTESSEAAWQTAVRELAEETGLVPDALYTAGVTDQFYNPVDDAIDVVALFVATVAAGAEITLNHENAEFRWTSLATAAETLEFRGQRAAADEVRRRFGHSAPPSWMRIAAYSPSSK